MPTMATSAISAASNPYSSRSWPSASRVTRAIAVIRRFMSVHLVKTGSRLPRPCPPQVTVFGALRRRRERRGDAAEDVVHVRAREPDGSDAHERDERDQQRVLEQVLTFVGPNHGTHARHHCRHVSLRLTTPTA